MPKCPLWANTRRKNTTRQCVKWVDVRASQQLTKSNAPTKENMLGTQEPSSEFSDVTTRLNKALLLVDESSVRQRSNSARIVQGFDLHFARLHARGLRLHHHIHVPIEHHRNPHHDVVCPRRIEAKPRPRLSRNGHQQIINPADELTTHRGEPPTPWAGEGRSS